MEEPMQTVKTTNRRSFLGASLAIVLLAAVAGVINTLVKYLWPTKEIVVAGATGGTTVIPLTDIPVGGSKTVRHLNKPYVVVRLTTGIYAVSAVCTHLGCIVY